MQVVRTKVHSFTHTSNSLGRHCCLWCTIPSSALKIPLKTRGNYPLRSLASLESDHASFLATGSDPKMAKECNNVIGTYLLDIPLEYV